MFNLQIGSKNNSIINSKKIAEESEADIIKENEDLELKKLLHYLKQILKSEDSKLMNQKTLQMQQFLLN